MNRHRFAVDHDQLFLAVLNLDKSDMSDEQHALHVAKARDLARRIAAEYERPDTKPERMNRHHAHRPRTVSLLSQVIGAGLFLAFVWLVIVYGYTA